MKISKPFKAYTMPFGILGLATVLSLGCDNKEKVLDIEGPRGGGIEVERDRKTGEVEVEVDRKKDEKLIDIDTPGTDVEVKRGPGGVDVDVDNK